MIHKVAAIKTEKKSISLFFFLLFKGTPIYGSSQARGQIRTAAAGLHHSHSNARSKLHV